MPASASGMSTRCHVVTIWRLVARVPRPAPAGEGGGTTLGGHHGSLVLVLNLELKIQVQAPSQP